MIPNTLPASHEDEPDYDSIDPDVRGLVRDLRRHGFLTTASCQGGPGHAVDLPLVTIAAEDVQSERNRLIWWVYEQEISATVRVEWLVQPGRVMPESHLMLRLWTRDHKWTR